MSRPSNTSAPQANANADGDTSQASSFDEPPAGNSSIGRLHLDASNSTRHTQDSCRLEGAPPVRPHPIQMAFLFGLAGLFCAVMLSLKPAGRKERSNHPTSVQTSSVAKRSQQDRCEGTAAAADKLIATTKQSSTDLPSFHGAELAARAQSMGPRRRQSGMDFKQAKGGPLALVSTSVAASSSEPVKLNEKDLADWMRGLKEEARQRGVSDKVINRALKGVRPVPQVIEKDRNQPEFKLTFEDYMKR